MSHCHDILLKAVEGAKDCKEKGCIGITSNGNDYCPQCMARQNKRDLKIKRNRVTAKLLRKGQWTTGERKKLKLMFQKHIDKKHKTI